MPKRKTSVSSPKDIMLSLIFVSAIVLGFAMVWYVDYVYAGDGSPETTLLFETDTNTEYMTFTTTDNYVFYPYFNVTTNARYIKGSVPHSDQLTPAYMGNHTWGMSIPEYDDTPYDHISSVVVMVIPDMDNWIMTNVKINMTMPNDDVTCLLTVLHLNSKTFGLTTYGSADPLSQETNLIAESVGTVAQWEVDFDVPLVAGLRINDLSQDQAYHCFEFGWVLDDASTGLLDYAQTWTVQVYGQQVTGWTIQDSLSVAIGTSVLVNVGVMVYMTDMVDIGPDIKDLPKRRKR